MQEIYSLKRIQKLIDEDLKILENSNLKQANREKYEKLKKEYQDLNKKILGYEEENNIITLKPRTAYALLNEYAIISSHFDFYMSFLGGYQEVADYQVAKIKENLSRIIKTLNKDNYEETRKKLFETWDLYTKILKNSLASQEVKNMYNQFNYQVYKYQIDDFVIDDFYSNYDAFLPFIMDDIQKILNGNEVPSYIKEKIARYSMDTSLIKTHFNEIIILLNLASNNRQATLEEIEAKLKEPLYKESDLIPEYHKPSQEILEYASNASYDLKKIFKIFKGLNEKVKELVPVVIIKNNSLSETYNQVCILLDEGFKDIRYLAEALIVENHFDKLLDFRKAFKNSINPFILEFDLAVIAHKKEISPKYLIHYIVQTNNKYLIKYVLRKNDLRYFTGEFIDYAISTNNKDILDYFESQKIRAIDSYLANEDYENEIKQQFLINSYFYNNLQEIKDYILNKLFAYKDKIVILKLFNKFDFDSREEALKILDNIPYPELKNEVLNEIYSCFKQSYNKLKNILIDKRLLDRKIYNGEPDFQNFNIFEAYIASTIMGNLYSSGIDILVTPFVRKFYNVKLDWNHLLDIAPKESRNEILKLFYKGNKEEFFELAKEKNYITSEFALLMLQEDPNRIIEFFDYLFVEDIMQLPKDILNIFSEFYKEKLEIEKISLNDKINTLLTKRHSYFDKDLKELLTFIMNEGIINSEILMYSENINGIPAAHTFLIKAIENSNDAYLRASYLNQLYENKRNIYEENILFLSEAEWNEIENEKENEEKKYVIKRKYYGALLKAFPKVSDIAKKRIVLSIAKSNIKEFIYFTAKNYHNYIDLLLENITDNNIYKELMDYSVNFENNVSNQK